MASNTFVDWPFLWKVRISNRVIIVAYPVNNKPTDINRTPPVVPLLIPLDWALWFVGLRPTERPDWMTRLMVLAMQGDKDVLSLIGPCPVKHPTLMRTSLYDYRFSLPGSAKAWRRWPMCGRGPSLVSWGQWCGGQKFSPKQKK